MYSAKDTHHTYLLQNPSRIPELCSNVCTSLSCERRGAVYQWQRVTWTVKRRLEWYEWKEPTETSIPHRVAWTGIIGLHRSPPVHSSIQMYVQCNVSMRCLHLWEWNHKIPANSQSTKFCAKCPHDTGCWQSGELHWELFVTRFPNSCFATLGRTPAMSMWEIPLQIVFCENIYTPFWQ